jgi:hypothetical protein
VLLGLAADRPVVFALRAFGATTVGRTAGSIPPPDVDLARFPSSDSVHRRHAEIEQADGIWRVTHLGRNPLVVQRPNETLVIQPGTSVALQPGDWLQFGRVRLRLLVAPYGSFDL